MKRYLCKAVIGDKGTLLKKNASSKKEALAFFNKKFLLHLSLKDIVELPESMVVLQHDGKEIFKEKK